MRLASHLHMSLDEVKRKTSSSQFVLWMEYLEWEVNAFDKTCYYLAQIAAEVRRPYMPKGKTVKVEDLILNFQKKKKISAEDQTKTDKLKKFFFGLTGLIGSAGKKKKGK